jgi:hypothetical protein
LKPRPFWSQKIHLLLSSTFICVTYNMTFLFKIWMWEFECACNLMKFNYYLCNYLKCKFVDLFVNRISLFYLIIVVDFHILIYMKVMWKFFAHGGALTSSHINLCESHVEVFCTYKCIDLYIFIYAKVMWKVFYTWSCIDFHILIYYESHVMCKLLKKILV